MPFQSSTFVAVGLLLTLGVLSSVPAAAAKNPLLLLTWSNYIDPEVVLEFETENHVELAFRYFASNDHRDELLAVDDAHGYDVVLVNGLMIDVYAKRGWLAAIAPEKIPNLVNLQARWRTAFPESEQYGVPYFWGTLGIAYRRDLAPNGFDKWSQFFRPQKSLRGRLAMPKSSRDVLGMALKSLGYSANTDDRGAIREAAAMLEAQKPFVHSYEYVSLDEQSALVTGRVWASMIYNGDALMLSNHHEDIVYVIPEEGTNLWVDYLAIMQRSPRRDLAAKFIDFLNRPRIAARNAQYVNYSTPNTAARSHLSKDYLDDPTIHPSDAVLARSEVYHKLSPRSQKTLNSVFVHLFAR